MPSVIVATGSKTIVDLSDGKSLSAYLGTNLPRTQIYDKNISGSGDAAYSPNWVSTNLVITPVVYADQTQIALNNAALKITYMRKVGSGNEEALTSNETVSGKVLTVKANVMNITTTGQAQITYVAHIEYKDPDTGVTITATAPIDFSLVATGADSHSVWISGEQTFKVDKSATVSPDSITLTAMLQGGISVSKWRYKDTNGDWADYPTGDGNETNTAQTLVVKPGHSVFVNNVASIRVNTSDANVYDITSVVKLVDGLDGDGHDAPIFFLTNESIAFNADKNGKIEADIAVICNVVAYQGLTKVTPTVGTIGGTISSQLTVTKGSASDNEIPLTITAKAGKTLSDKTSGDITVPVSIANTSPLVSTTLKIHWTKISKGADGASGENAIVFSLYAPKGSTFMNQEGSLPVVAQVYDGATPLVTYDAATDTATVTHGDSSTTNPTFAWAKYESGSWVDVAGTTPVLVVAGSSVTNLGSYRCTMTYNGKTYTDILTLVDKTDSYVAEIESTGGDIFKNTQGVSFLICRLFQNGKETDAVKGANYVVDTADVPSPSANTFAYVVGTAPNTVLKKYSGSAWADASAAEQNTHTYKWYRRDKDGASLDDGAVFATGKVIYVTGQDVDTKTTFICEVE